MKRAGRPATYGLETSLDLFRKLEWEVDHYKHASENDADELYFHAFNAAVTAWHIADWVWKDLSPEQRQQLEKDWGKKLRENGGDFKGTLRLKNRDIAICREIATASKHFEITSSRDETIDTVASATTSAVHDSEGRQIQAGDALVTVTRYKLKVIDGNDRREFVDVLDATVEFWGDFFNTYCIGK